MDFEVVVSSLPEDFGCTAKKTELSDNLVVNSRTYNARLSDEDQLLVFGALLTNRLAGKVWPAYSWDESPAIYLLLVDRDLALAEINRVIDIPPLTESQFRTVLNRFCGTERDLQAAIQSFYASRKERRIRARLTASEEHLLEFHPSKG